MKLHLSRPGGVNTFTGYGDGYVLLNGQRRDASLIVLPERELAWTASAFERLQAEDFVALAGLDVQIVLLGTGRRQRFPHPRLTVSLAKARIGLEVMDTQAACRTFNILVAEERRVAAALLFA